MSTPSTPASPPLTTRPLARIGHAARRLTRLPRALGRTLALTLRRLLARLLWLLHGWAGLLAGALVALALWLGPFAGARRIAVLAAALSHHAAAALTTWYQTAYDAVAWPAANGLAALRAVQAWAHHGLHGLAPTVHGIPWTVWMRHGAAWRYLALQGRGGAPVRAALPLELAGALGLLVLIVLVVAIGRRKRGLDPTRRNTYGGARWQTWDELRRRRARPGDLVLGTARRGLRTITVGIPADLLVEGVAICAPNGLGKSNALYKGQLLAADPAVDYVATDPKGEHWAQTAAALSRTHDVFRLDMQTPAASVTWAPLSLERTQAQAEAWAAAWLRNTTPAGSAPAVAYFEQALILLIAAGVAHVHTVAAAAGRATGTLGELVDLLLQPTIERIEARLLKTPGGIPPAAGQFLGLIKEHKDLRTSIPSGLAPRLSTLTDAAVRAVVGGAGTLDLDRLGRRGRAAGRPLHRHPRGRPHPAPPRRRPVHHPLPRAHGPRAHPARRGAGARGAPAPGRVRHHGRGPRRPRPLQRAAPGARRARPLLPDALAARRGLRRDRGGGPRGVVQRAGLAGRDARQGCAVGQRDGGQAHGAGLQRGRLGRARRVRAPPRARQPLGERGRRALAVPGGPARLLAPTHRGQRARGPADGPAHAALLHRARPQAPLAAPRPARVPRSPRPRAGAGCPPIGPGPGDSRRCGDPRSSPPTGGPGASPTRIKLRNEQGRSFGIIRV